MASYRLPPISATPNLSSLELATILDHLFEPCMPLHTLSMELLQSQSFSSYEDCITSIGVQLTALAESASTSDTNWLESILGAHPRLGEKKIDSKQSQSEQAQLASEGEASDDKLEEMNAVYESTFPGLRYVVFVNGRDRTTIIQDMQARINRNDIALERAQAIQAMCQIAAERARKLYP